MPIDIAIADDHELIRKAIIDLINKFPNCRVTTEGSNGVELVEAIDCQTTKPTLCILDIEMPVMNGYQTLRYLKRVHPEMKFLVLTAFNSEYSIMHMIKSGANGYLLKNCTPESLQRAIIDIHEIGYHYSCNAPRSIFKCSLRESLSEFTPKELIFISLCCSNLTYAKIGEQMRISERTVHDYHEVVCKKTGIHSRIEIVLFAIQSGLIALSNL